MPPSNLPYKRKRKDPVWYRPRAIVDLFLNFFLEMRSSHDSQGAEGDASPPRVSDVEGRGGCGLLAVAAAVNEDLMPHARDAGPHLSGPGPPVTAKERVIEMRWRVDVRNTPNRSGSREAMRACRRNLLRRHADS
jgi:hypothetical protein